MRYKLNIVSGRKAQDYIKHNGGLLETPLAASKPVVLEGAKFAIGGELIPDYGREEIVKKVEGDSPALHAYRADRVDIIGNRFLLIDERYCVFNRFQGNEERAPEVGVDLCIETDERGQVFYKEDETLVDIIHDDCMLAFWEAARMYHHWLFECLPRILLAMEQSEFDGVKFLLPVDAPGFVHSTLEFLQVPASRLVYYDPRRITRLSSLILTPVPTFEPDQCTASCLEILRTKALECLGKLETKETPKRVLFTRRDALTGERVLLNEDDLVAGMEKLGFTAIEPGDVSFEEQVRLANGAETIACVHGSAGANLLFCREGANVLHLFPDCVHYFLTHGVGTAVAGANYGYVYGPSFQRRLRFHNNPWLLSTTRVSEAMETIK